jgi:UDP-GlcNAc:undecaprenyl-phosphate/decaprenyl-phosphate GlcNAc-1-phosphate transferase
MLIVALSAVGLVLLLLPRFTPRAPRWAEAFVPPRYRRRKTLPQTVPPLSYSVGEQAEEVSEERTPVPAGVNGATAIGPRSRFPDRRKAGTRG